MLGDHSPRRDRAAIALVDVILGFLTLVALMVLAPVIYSFVGWVRPEVDPLSQLLLTIVVPVLFISMIVSLGVSARGGA